VLAFGSDWPVAPMDPLMGIYAPCWWFYQRIFHIAPAEIETARVFMTIFDGTVIYQQTHQ
jgi:predicted amidohydrolase YtcJ